MKDDLRCEQQALLRVIKIIGSQRKLALKLGVSVARLNHWINRGIQIPAKYAMRMEILTRCQVLAQELCSHCRKEFVALKGGEGERGVGVGKEFESSTENNKNKEYKSHKKTGANFENFPSPISSSLSSSAEVLAQYLMNCPHKIMQNTCSLPEKFICDDLLWDKKSVRQTLQELIAAKYLKAEIQQGLLFVDPQHFLRVKNEVREKNFDVMF